MNVLHVYKDYAPVLGGIENHIGDLARAQARAGHDVTVLVTRPAGGTTEERDEGVRVIRAGRLATVASTPLSVALPARLAARAPDVTHLHFPYPVGEIAHLLLGRSRRTVITYHSDVVRQAGILRFYEPILRRVLARADAIVATSPAYVQTSRFLRPVAAKTVVIPLGIALDRFAQPDGTAAAALRRRIAPDGAPLFLAVGRLRHYKGLHVALAALPSVRGRLAIVGTGPEEAALRALVRELGLGERVHFAGEVGDLELPHWYGAADVFVSSASNRAEAFGISIVEALASGLPAVTTELGTGTSFVNQDGVTGLVVPANAPRELAAALERLGGDPDLRRRFGEAARTRAAAEFDISVMVQRVLALYSGLLARPG
jgi:glycosyltransferase involved in cell wall biosynthesis